MVRLAAEQWNIPENEIDANFDPLLMLIFDAVASEIEGVGYQIRDIQNTLLDELSSLMLPEALLRTKPASCILSAQPNEKTGFIKKENNFSTIAQTQKVGEPVQEKELNFTPIGNVKLFNASLGYLRVGDKVFKHTTEGRKITARDEQRTNAMVNEVHFTIHCEEAMESLEGMQLFFDLRNHSEANNFYFTLQSSILTINNNPAVFTKGYYENEQFAPDIKDAFNRKNNYSRKIQKEIASIYADQFITIGETPVQANTASHAILDGLPEKLTAEMLLPNVVFCTLQLSRPFDIEVLDRLQVGINAFPAINRKLEHITYKTDKWINIIPLPVKNSYLDINSIEVLGGAQYKIQPAGHEDKVTEGEAIVRTSRVAKRSSRDVRNTIKSLLEAIRDESAYFSRVSNDFVTSRLAEISRILTRLEDQVQLSKDEKQAFHYVLLKAKNAGEHVQVSYWTTDPEDAGYVKSNAPFKPVQHTLTAINGTFSLTSAMGGLESLSEYSQKQMLVRQLSSRGKIISIEDVKLLCYELFGSKLKQAAIQKKMKVMPGNSGGIARVINITLTVNKNDYPENELIYLQKLLRYQLDTNAGFMFPFEIEVEEV